VCCARGGGGLCNPAESTHYGDVELSEEDIFRCKGVVVFVIDAQVGTRVFGLWWWPCLPACLPARPPACFAPRAPAPTPADPRAECAAPVGLLRNPECAAWDCDWDAGGGGGKPGQAVRSGC
jgi:hypothetical protein